MCEGQVEIVMRLRILGTYAALLIFGVALEFWLAREIAVDRCLDRGGSWSKQYAMCDFK